jgi:hypothetical protein
MERPNALIPMSTLRPLPGSLRGMECEACRKPGAVWALGRYEQAETLCSLCVLYASPLGTQIQAEFDAFAAGIEEKRGQPFTRTEGRLSVVREADAVLGRFVFAGRMNAAYERMGLAAEVMRLLRERP